MRIAISSQKGGVGKTTLAINLAYAFAKAGYRTLLIDTDPQGSVGLSVTRKSSSLLGFYDVLSNPILDWESLAIPTRLKTFSILPAGKNPSFSAEENFTSSDFQRILQHTSLKKYDIVLIDTAAGLFRSTQQILHCIDAVLIPQQAEPLGIRSLPYVLEGLKRIRENNKKLKILGICLTMYQKNVPECVAAVKSLREMLPPAMLLKAMVPREDSFLKASAKGVPVSLLSSQETLTQVFEDLRSEILSKLDHPKTSL